jgi:hypothetical protein
MRVHWALWQVSVLVAVVAVLAGRPVRAQEVSSAGPAAVDAQELAGLAPTLDSRRPDLKSFEVKGFVVFNETHRMTFHCVSTVPQHACVVLIDEVPFLVAAGDHILLYDALAGPHLWHAEWGFFLGIQDGGLKFNYDVYDRGNAKAGILVDLPAILQRAAERRLGTALGDSRYRLTGFTRAGCRLEALIDLARPGRYSRVTGRGVDGTRVFEVAIISVDEPIPPGAFVFPRFGDHAPLPEPTEITRENRGEVMKQVATLFFHLALADVSKRREVEQTLGRPLDWSALQEREATIASRLLRALEADSALRP